MLAPDDDHGGDNLKEQIRNYDPSGANVTEQMKELQSKHEQTMAAISALHQRSYVYVPRERHILPYCGDMEKDGRSVDDFIEEVEWVLRARHQSDFGMSLLRARPWKRSAFVVLLMMGLTICLNTSGRHLETGAAHLNSCKVFIVENNLRGKI